MLKLARWSTTHRKYVVIGWVILLLGTGFISHAVGASYSNNFTLPNSDAQRASDLLEKSFPKQAGDRDTIVYKVNSGTVQDPAVRKRMSSMFAEVEKLPHVAAVISPYSGPTAGKSISADKQIAFATVVFNEKANLLPKSAAERVVSVARAAEQPGLQVELGGEAIEATQQPGFGISLAVGLLAAVVILLLTFGSVLAMGLPILTALFGLGTGLSLIALFTHVVDTPNFSSELAAMIGLGVGIDYALFILTRFREAYATQGPTFEDARESVVQAIDTAGRAVLFAGSTVVIALLGDDAARRRIPLRPGDLRVDRRAARDVRLAHAAPGAADDRRRARCPGRAPSAQAGARAGAVALRGGSADGCGVGCDRQGRRVDPLERVRATAPEADRRGCDGDDAADRGARGGAATRLKRRLQRPRGPDDPSRL